MRPEAEGRQGSPGGADICKAPAEHAVLRRVVLLACWCHAAHGCIGGIAGGCRPVGGERSDGCPVGERAGLPDQGSATSSVRRSTSLSGKRHGARRSTTDSMCGVSSERVGRGTSHPGVCGFTRRAFFGFRRSGQAPAVVFVQRRLRHSWGSFRSLGRVWHDRSRTVVA